MRFRIPKKVKRTTADEGPARKKRKLNEKLILILDIDHTFLHASRNPQAFQVLEHEDFKETVHKFFLSGSKAPYFVKLRPGFDTFLREISKYFEIHVYTMGVRRYAEKVISLFDDAENPAIKQLVARDDYPEDPHTKTLNRLFDVDENRTIILDDRIDVWANPRRVLHIHKYTFWPDAEDRSGRHVFGFTSVRCRKVIKMAEQTKLRVQLYTYWKDLHITRMKFNTRGVQVFTAQTPGEKALKRLEKKLNEKDKIPCRCEYVVNLEELKRRDGDEVLSCVQRVLTEIYKLNLEKEMNSIKLLAAVKSRTFRGLRFVFSGIIPRGESPWESTIWMKAEEFGAKCYKGLSEDNVEGVTHVICDRAGTDKVNTALKLSLYIVHINWFWNSVVHFMRSNEEFYCLPKLEYANRKRAVQKEDEMDEEPLPDMIDEPIIPAHENADVGSSLNGVVKAAPEYSFMNDSDEETPQAKADATEKKVEVVQTNKSISSEAPEPQGTSEDISTESNKESTSDQKDETMTSSELGKKKDRAIGEVAPGADDSYEVVDDEPPGFAKEAEYEVGASAMEVVDEEPPGFGEQAEYDVGMTASLDDDLFDDMIADSEEEEESPPEAVVSIVEKTSTIKENATEAVEENTAAADVDATHEVEGESQMEVEDGKKKDKSESKPGVNSNGEPKKESGKPEGTSGAEKVEEGKSVNKKQKRKKRTIPNEEDDPDMDFDLLENLTNLTRKDPSEIPEVVMEPESAVQPEEQDIIPEVSEEEDDSYGMSEIDRLLEKTKPQKKKKEPEEAPGELDAQTEEGKGVEIDLTKNDEDKPPSLTAKVAEDDVKKKAPPGEDPGGLSSTSDQEEDAPANVQDLLEESQSASTSSDLLYAAQELVDHQEQMEEDAARAAAAEKRKSRKRSSRQRHMAVATVEVVDDPGDGDDEEFNYGIIKRKDGKDSSDEEEEFDFTLFETTKDTKKREKPVYSSFGYEFESTERKRKKWI